MKPTMPWPQVDAGSSVRPWLRSHALSTSVSSSPMTDVRLTTGSFTGTSPVGRVITKR